MLIAPESIMYVLLVIEVTCLITGLIGFVPFSAYTVGRSPKSVELWFVSIFYLALMVSIGGDIGQELGDNGGYAVQLSFIVLYPTGLLIGLLHSMMLREMKEPEVS